MTNHVDYLVVGAGSAGCVLANRLSENSGRHVTLLESGPTDSRAEIRIPAAFPRLMGTECAWDRRTVAQAELGGRELYWPSGRTLGGSSSINAQIWTHGHPHDYTTWAQAAGDQWDTDRMRWARSRAEYSVATDTGLRVGALRDPDPRARDFLTACDKVGITALRADQLSTTDGSGMLQVSQHHGRRFSVADGYLTPTVERDNLTVRTDVLVRRILFDGTRAVGVEYTDSAGDVYQQTCRRDVLVCCGAVGSPRLLLASGIGDPDHLTAQAIPLVAAVPGVGTNLMDHLQVPILVTETPDEVDEPRNPSVELARYFTGRRGPLSSNLAEAAAFVRVEPGASAPDIELLWMPVQFEDHGRDTRKRGFTICVVLLAPHSRGRIWLGPDRDAVIDPAYLHDPRDRPTLARGLQLATQVIAAHPTGVDPQRYTAVDTDAAAQYVIDNRAETLYHPAGTCRMGVDVESVVDPYLRVRGVSGLRVVDAAVMPVIPRAHTNAPTVALAENAARLIRATENILPAD